MEGEVVSKSKFIDAQDKKKGALVILEDKIIDRKDPNICYQTNIAKFFIRGLGGFGGTPFYVDNIKSPPQRRADKVVKEQTLKR